MLESQPYRSSAAVGLSNSKAFATPPRPQHSQRPPRTTQKRAWPAPPQDNKPNNPSNNSVSTPSSVLISTTGSLPLTRDLSDLSGSYAGRTTATAASSSSHPRNVVTGDDIPQQSWCQARVLSAREPHHPQPKTDCNDSVTATGALVRSKTKPQQNQQQQQHPTMLVNASSVEVIENNLDNKQRIPLIVLLMDPSRKMYELAQLWVDWEEDSVRNVLHGIQLHLHDKPHWKQDYDGLFQVRNHNFSQLIHILDICKYDCQEYELWVAKPWSMSAKATVSFAGGLIHRLKELNILRQSPGRQGESILVLSKEARSRIYVPEGVLKHYHACQFLSFSPSFEPIGAPTIRVDVLGADSEDGCSQLSDSHCYSVASRASSDRALLSSSSRPSSVLSTPSVKRTASRNKSNVVTPSTAKTTNTSTRTTPSPLSKRTNCKSNSKSMMEQQKRIHEESSSLTKNSSRSLVQALSLLKCTACKRESSSSTLLDTTTMVGGGVGPTWQAAWEDSVDGSMSVSVAPSVVSESFPLLKAGTGATTRGWKFEI